jgi:hypothetical protein
VNMAERNIGARSVEAATYVKNMAEEGVEDL